MHWCWRLWHELADDTHARREREVRAAVAALEDIDVVGRWLAWLGVM